MTTLALRAALRAMGGSVDVDCCTGRLWLPWVRHFVELAKEAVARKLKKMLSRPQTSDNFFRTFSLKLI